jgi:hypothetical protein
LVPEIILNDQIFERINTSGRTLMPQEIRNCVYTGALNGLLIELNKNSSWRKLLGKQYVDRAEGSYLCKSRNHIVFYSANY